MFTRVVHLAPKVAMTQTRTALNGTKSRSSARLIGRSRASSQSPVQQHNDVGARACFDRACT